MAKKSVKPLKPGKKHQQRQNGGLHPTHTEEFIEQEAVAFIEWIKQHKNVYFKRFALERGYHPQRLSEFADKNSRFAEALVMAQGWQECKLVDGGLNNQFNPGFTKFVMVNNHGWTDKQQISGDSANPFTLLLQEIDGKSKDLISEDD